MHRGPPAIANSEKKTKEEEEERYSDTSCEEPKRKLAFRLGKGHRTEHEFTKPSTVPIAFDDARKNLKKKRAGGGGFMSQRGGLAKGSPIGGTNTIKRSKQGVRARSLRRSKGGRGG